VRFVINRNQNTQKYFEAGIDRNLKGIISPRVDESNSERCKEKDINQGNQMLDHR
jgi:hypothetical protein